MSKSISRRARHRLIYTYAVWHGNYPHGYGQCAYVGAKDAQDAARARIASLAEKTQVAKSYYTFTVLELPLVSEKKRPRSRQLSAHINLQPESENERYH